MKTLRVYLGILVVCFAVGMGLLLASPATTQAGPDPCNSHCYKDGCQLGSLWNCATDYAYVRCYAWYGPICDEEIRPIEYNCRCSLLYCTDLACNIP